jgi:REP element-mobilizing transposase RayT
VEKKTMNETEPPSQNLRVALAYFITFTCYGGHLHGDESGSVDREHNLPGMPYLEPNPETVKRESERMTQPPYRLDAARARVVLSAIKEVCCHRKWNLLAAHVRSTHVHVVVQARERPERIMVDFKAYASRALTRAGFEHSNCKRWSRHGSTRYVRKMEDLEAAVHYVLYGQGEAVSVYDGRDTDIEAIFRRG